MIDSRLAGGLRVKRVLPAEYFSSRGGWDELVCQSGVDRLFLGYDWQRAWWQSFGPRLGLEPWFLLVLSGEDTVGRVGFFAHAVSKFGAKWGRLELLGNVWSGPATLRSEFLDIVAVPSLREEAADAVIGWLLSQRGWDELVLIDMSAESVLANHFSSSTIPGCLRRHLGAERSYTVSITGTFEAFCAGLSAGERRRTFNQRKRLEARGPLVIEDWAINDQVALAELERLHQLRWGSPLLGGGRLEMITALSQALPAGAVRVSLLKSGGRAVSALLQVRLSDTEYNLQGGLDAAFGKGVSPARIHWGMLIEKAYRDGIPKTFDLLAGGGKREQFKAAFAAPGRLMSSVHLIRDRRLALAYRVRDLASSIRLRFA